MGISNLEYCAADTGVISALADKPNDSGMSAAQLKAKFDAAGTGLKEYINETLVPYVNGTVKAAIEGNTDEIEKTVESMHSHENKALLDSYTQTDTALAVAVEKAHSHENMDALDSFTKTMSELMDEIYAKAKLDAHPVGSVYISELDTSPEDLFGGKWERIKDRFLLAAGDTYTAGEAKGEATHKLTVDEMPSHRHTAYPFSMWYDSSNYDAHLAGGSLYYWQLDSDTRHTTYTGGSAAHNNMPPYLVVYVWKRVA